MTQTIGARNTGAMLARWCNEHVKATPHRVVTFPGRERYSVAFFCDPDKDGGDGKNCGELTIKHGGLNQDSSTKLMDFNELTRFNHQTWISQAGEASGIDHE